MNFFRLKVVRLRPLLPGGLLALVLVFIYASSALNPPAVSGQASDLKVSWRLPDSPAEARVGLRLTLINLELTNSGALAWPRTGSNTIRLGYRWFSLENKQLDPKNKDNGYDDLRAEMPVDIPAGGRVVFPQVLVGTPALPGDYVLRLDLTRGDEYWLADRGGQDFSFKVTVRARDTTGPQARVRALPLFSTSTLVNVAWEGQDEDGGSGLANFDVQYRLAGQNDWRDWVTTTQSRAAQFAGENGKLYLFRARATDLAGNKGQYPANEQASTRLDSLPPSVRVEALAAYSAEHFLVRWPAFDNVAGQSVLCDVQYRQGEDGPWTDWQLGNSAGSAIFKGESGLTYYFRARATDYAGNQGEFPLAAQASTRAMTAYNSLALLATAVSLQGTGTVIRPALQTAAFFPLSVKNGENRTGTTNIMIYNPWPDPLDVFVRFNDRAGAPVTTTVNLPTPATVAAVNPQTRPLSPDEAVVAARVETLFLTIPPGATSNVWAGALLPASYNGWAELRSEKEFVASAVRQPAEYGQPVAYAAARSGERLYLPYIRKAGSQGSSFINLTNISTVPAEFTITYYDAAGGQQVASEQRILPRLGSGRFSLSSIAGTNPNLRFSGSAIISSNVPLAASVETLLEDGMLSTYPAVAAAADPALAAGNQAALTLPVYREADNITSTLLVQNTAKEPVQVRLEFRDNKDNLVATRENRLAGFGRWTLWANDVKELPPGFEGRIRIIAGSSEAVLAVISPGASSKTRLFS